ncbi:hypothetical protein NL529_33830, partial [Klebsiella pneumoniae]|nr:hypothetical protein [Klebsiella pneumoniae]
ESYATVAFLVDRYGMRTFRDLVTAMATQPDWRPAMRAVYNRDPGEVEKQWRDNVTAWAAGDWRINLVASFDLNPAREM